MGRISMQFPEDMDGYDHIAYAIELQAAFQMTGRQAFVEYLERTFIEQQVKQAILGAVFGGVTPNQVN